MSFDDLQKAIIRLELRIATLEAIHELGPPTQVPRHIASPTEQELTAERDEARAFARWQIHYKYAPADPQRQKWEREYPWLKEHIDTERNPA